MVSILVVTDTVNAGTTAKRFNSITGKKDQSIRATGESSAKPASPPPRSTGSGKK